MPKDIKIVLIQPKAYKHKPQHIDEPLGLGYLASFLLEKGYKNIEIKIGALEPEEGIIKDAASADVVGITATSPMMTHGRELARKIKKVNEKAIIVFGGCHPSATPNTTLEDMNINIVVRGEGEITFCEIVLAIEMEKSLSEVKGISFRHENQIIHNPDRELIKNVDSISFPARDLLKQDIFTEKNKDRFYGRRDASVLSSRGCPYKCTYCASHKIWTRKWRARSPQNILAEIRELVENYQIEHITFQDDTFTVNRKRCMEFCILLKEEKFDITWTCHAHVNTADYEMFKTMRSAGCKEIWMGVESGSPLILKELGKRSKPQQVEKAFKLSKKAGLRRRAYFMIGSPSESHETIWDTKRLLKRIKPDYAWLTILTPYPGCELYDFAKRKGYVNDNMDWSIVDLHSSITMPTTLLTKDELKNEYMNFAKLVEKYKRKEKLRIIPLLKRVIEKLQVSNPKEYPSLAVKFFRYVGKRSL